MSLFPVPPFPPWLEFEEELALEGAGGVGSGSENKSGSGSENVGSDPGVVDDGEGGKLDSEETDEGLSGWETTGGELDSETSADGGFCSGVSDDTELGSGATDEEELSAGSPTGSSSPPEGGSTLLSGIGVLAISSNTGSVLDGGTGSVLAATAMLLGGGAALDWLSGASSPPPATAQTATTAAAEAMNQPFL